MDRRSGILPPRVAPLGSLVFANFLAPNMTPVYRSIAERVGHRVGRRGMLADSATEGQLAEGQVDVAFICGLPAVRMLDRADRPIRVVAAPIVGDPRSQGRPVYFSDVVVRRDRRFRRFADLRGAAWAYNVESSFSGWLLPRCHLVELGETEAFFGRVCFTGSHQASIDAVLAGTADAAAIDSHVLGVERRQRPQLADELRIIEALGPSTIPPVVVSTRLPPNLQAAVQDALCSLNHDAAARRLLAEGLIERFVAMDDRAYDDIRAKVGVVEGASIGPDS